MHSAETQMILLDIEGTTSSVCQCFDVVSVLSKEDAKVSRQ
ncbi:MAG: hypothetical protein R3D26_24575 [Cyanobacteriota/Melainabacteria group bacterium]